MIVVTGGTGFVGTHLTRRLLAEGEAVRVLARDAGRAQDLASRGAEVVVGDVTEPGSLTGAFAGVETVFHLVAIIRERGQATFQRVNVEGTRNVVRACRAAGVRRLLHLSALGVRDDPAYRYIYSKYLGERAVRESGLDWTIFRPSVIYGPGFGFFDRLLQSIRMAPPPIVPVPGSGRARFQPIWVGDVVECVVRALANPGSVGQTYELGGPEHLTYEEMLDLLMEVRGIRRIKVHVPLPLIRLAAPVMGLAMADPPVSPVELKQLDVDNVTDLDGVRRRFGFDPRPLREGLEYLRARRPDLKA